MKKNFILCGLTALLVGCSLGDESFDVPTSFAKIDKVKLSVDSYEFADGLDTRSTLTFTGTDFLFGWANGDSLGMFPVSPAGSQVYQVLDGKKEESVLTYSFDGGAWTIKSGNSYVGYYPFKSEMRLAESFDAIPVNMVGQKQDGKGSTSHLGKFDYMFTDATEVGESENNVNFQFHHIGSIVQANLTVPAAKTWKKIVFEAKSDVFVTKALMNAVEGTFKSVEKTNTIELALENVSSNANEQMTFYLEVLPTTVGAMTVTVVDADGIYYTGDVKYRNDVTSQTMLSGKAYRWNATLKEADEYAGKDYVLLAGTLWGRNNVNISGISNGEYYAWAEIASLTVPNSGKDSYDWSNYSFGTGTDDIWFYCPSDNTSRMADYDDVAHVNMPVSDEGYWRIPTKAEMERLVRNCTWKAIEENGELTGYKVSDPDIAERYIILPAAGGYKGTALGMYGQGWYWTSDVDVDSENWSQASCLSFDKNGYAVSSLARCYGLPIRPVFVKN